MIVTKAAVGTKFEYRVDGEVFIKASVANYEFAARTTINGREIVTFHKTRAAAAKGATVNIWSARMGTVAGRNTASYRGKGTLPAPVVVVDTFPIIPL